MNTREVINILLSHGSASYRDIAIAIRCATSDEIKELAKAYKYSYGTCVISSIFEEIDAYESSKQEEDRLATKYTRNSHHYAMLLEISNCSDYSKLAEEIKAERKAIEELITELERDGMVNVTNPNKFSTKIQLTDRAKKLLSI